MVIIRGNERYFMDKGWIKGYRNFSFQDYYDEYNDHFGNLIVLNDEEFAPGKGFKSHPTSDIEMITYVEKGELEVFNEKLKEKTTLKPGDFQLLSSGKGIKHSIMNKCSDQPTSFLQFWFTPSQFEMEPTYYKVSPTSEDVHNKLYRVFSQKMQAPGKIHQDVNFYFSLLEKGKELSLTSEKGRGLLVFVLEGQLKIQDNILDKRDCLRTMNQTRIDIRAEKDSKFFLVDTR